MEYSQRRLLIIFQGIFVVIICSTVLYFTHGVSQVWKQLSPVLLSISSMIGNNSISYGWIVVIILCGLFGFLLGRS